MGRSINTSHTSGTGVPVDETILRRRHRNLVNINRWYILVVLLATCLGSAFTVKSAETAISGIIDYVYERNPQRITPKMYNWEVKLSDADSRNGTYEIVQITEPRKADPMATDTEPKVLVESKMIVPNRDGIIDFKLHAGDKEPTQHMGRQGNSGQPIIFSGRGTGKGASNWIVLPGTKTDRVIPSAKGTQLVASRLRLIQFIVSNDKGDKFQVNVILRRK